MAVIGQIGLSGMENWLVFSADPSSVQVEVTCSRTSEGWAAELSLKLRKQGKPHASLP